MPLDFKANMLDGATGLLRSPAGRESSMLRVWGPPGLSQGVQLCGCDLGRWVWASGVQRADAVPFLSQVLPAVRPGKEKEEVRRGRQLGRAGQRPPPSALQYFRLVLNYLLSNI